MGWLRGEAVPEVIKVQHASNVKHGDGVLLRPELACMNSVVDWVDAVMARVPVNYSRKIGRMCLKDMWTTIIRHQEDERRAAIESQHRVTEILALAMVDCPVVHEYADGWKWVHVTGMEALRAEGNAMRHCVGDTIRGYHLLTGMSAILSLRDSKGMPRVTAQMYGDQLVMAKGRSNSEPVNYRKRVDDLVYRCGAMLQTHHVVGWADDELTWKVRASKVVREAEEVEKRARVEAERFAIDTEIARIAIVSDTETDHAVRDREILLLESAEILDRLRLCGVHSDRMLMLAPDRQVAFDPAKLLSDYYHSLRRRDGANNTLVSVAFDYAYTSARVAAMMAGTITERITAQLHDPAVLETVQHAVARGDAAIRITLQHQGHVAIASPVGVLAAYQALLASRARMPEGIPIRDDWGRGFLGSNHDEQLERFVQQGDADASIHGVHAGQGTRGSIRPGMAADEMMAGSVTHDRPVYPQIPVAFTEEDILAASDWDITAIPSLVGLERRPPGITPTPVMTSNNQWRQMRSALRGFQREDRRIEDDALDCLVYAFGAHADYRPGFTHYDQAIAFDPSAPAPSTSAPKP